MGGEAFGTVVSDQSGDGLDDLVSGDAGSAHSVSVHRATGGAVVWQRAEIVMNGAAFVEDAGRLTGAGTVGRPVQDLALLTAPAPGAAGNAVGALGLLADPTAGAHGQVTLLAGGTGHSVWSHVGDDVYPLERAGGVPAPGVATDQSSTSATSTTAQLQLLVLNVAGRTVWQKTYSLSVPHSAASQDIYFAFALAGIVLDLDGDGGYEGYVVLFVVDASTGAEAHQVNLVRASDGAAIKDTTSGFLDGSVTGNGQDRVKVIFAKPGMTVLVLRGSDDARRWQRTVPGSQSITTGDAWGYSLTSRRCEDVLVNGLGRGRALIGVLASNGSPRWTITRGATDQRPGSIAAPRTPPNPSC